MTKSATDVMQDIIFSAVIDAIASLKTASKGLPNTLLRDINAVHANTTFADLPKELQATITASVRAAFTRLLREGYHVSAEQAAPSRLQPVRREAIGPAGGRRTPPRRDGGDGRRPPADGERRNRKPRPPATKPPSKK